jgi:pyruvate dehydrogenase E1 component beta subunit
LLIQSIRDNDPVIFFEHKLLYGLEGEVPEESYAIPFGEANVIREGDDVTMVTIGRMVHVAQQAAEELAKEGIQAEVIDLRTTSPSPWSPHRTRRSHFLMPLRICISPIQHG